ncbi:MAG: hypothetical protein HOP06_04840 [Methylotenera sp.]|nr:hypothetical protein [Methylotenera sp.]
MKLYRSDWTGIILGVIFGAYQPFAILNKPIVSSFPHQALIQVMVFGLIGPPILALISRLFITNNSSFQEKIGRYVNLVFMMVAYGITTGAVGLGYHLLVGLPHQALMPIVFFGSAGFGFLGAYFINPQAAYRPHE